MNSVSRVDCCMLKPGLTRDHAPYIAAFLAVLVLFIPSAEAAEEGDWLVRLGAMHFDPQSSSRPVTTPGSGALGSSGVGFDANSQVGLSLSYMLSNSWAVEATMSAPFEHDLSISGLDAYGLNTNNLGEVKQVSPGLSALYYFGTANSRFRPYLGAGFNYTTFFDDSLSTQVRSELDAQGLELDEHLAISARAGFDFRLGNGWFLNASVWRMNIDTNASFDSRFGRISTYTEMDPWVYSISVGHDLEW